jgi:hypothetical protein
VFCSCTVLDYTEDFHTLGPVASVCRYVTVVKVLNVPEVFSH